MRMAVNPGRSLDITAELEVDPVSGIRLGASQLERTLRLAFGEGPEIEDDTLPLSLTRVRVRIEVNPPPSQSSQQLAVEVGKRTILALYEAGELIERERVVEALRAGERNDSGADQVEFVSDLVGWSAEDDEVLKAERNGA